MFELAQQRDVLQLGEALLGTLPLLLADGVAQCRVVRASMALPPARFVFFATCGVTNSCAKKWSQAFGS